MLGIALQGIVANFMSSLLLAFRQSFAVGDLIETCGFQGEVLEINLRTTVLRLFSGPIARVPNKVVLENPIVNLSTSGVRRIEVRVGVAYATDLARAQEVAPQALGSVPRLLPERPMELFWEQFGESSIDLLARFWVPFRSQGDALAAQSQAAGTPGGPPACP